MPFFRARNQSGTANATKFIYTTMPDNNNTLPDALRDEMTQLKSQYLMSPTDRRRKLIRWAIRQMLTALLYFFFWDAHPWVPKSLWLVAPLAVASLLSIVGYNWFLERKMRKTETRIEELEERMKEPGEE